MNESTVDVRPLGYLALGSALISVALSWTYFLSVLSYIPALVAVPLGLAAREFAATRHMGTISLALALLSAAVATVILFVSR